MSEFAGKVFQGQWWLPDARSTKYEGVLALDDDCNGTLTLKGAVGSLRTLPDEVPVLHGSGRASGDYSRPISLFLLRKVQYSSSPASGIEESEFFINSAVFGSHIPSLTDPAVLRVRVRTTGLESWCDRTSFSGDVRLEDDTESENKLRRVRVDFSPNSAPFTDLGNGSRMRFTSLYTGPATFGSSKRVSMQEVDYVELAFDEAISLEELPERVLVWQTFLTLAMRRASLPIEIRFEPVSGGGVSQEYVLAGMKRDETQSRANRSQVLFLRSTLSTSLPTRLRGWAEAYEKLRAGILLYAGVAYQEGIYVHAGLLSYLQALEVLHGDLYPKERRFDNQDIWKATLAALRAAIPSDLNDELRSSMSQSLGFLGSLTLAERLTSLYDKHALSVRELFRDKAEDMAWLKDVRNFLTHYGDRAEIDQSFLTSRRAVVLREKARFFVEIVLLGAIGMTDTEIQGIVNGCDYFGYWRRQGHRDHSCE